MNLEYLPFVSLDDRILPAAEAQVSPLGLGFMAGFGLFETVRVCQGRPLFFSEHYCRLQSSARALGLELKSDRDRLHRRCMDVMGANKISEGALKIVLFRDRNCDRELVALRNPVYPESEYARGFNLQTVQDLRPAAGPSHKTTNYLKNLLAGDAARKAGFDDALFVEPSERIYETTRANIFIVQAGEVYTPPLTRSILPGIVRDQVLRRWPRATEKEITLPELLAADEVFITNAVLGVMPVARIDGQLYPKSGYKVVPALSEALAAWQGL